MTSTVRRLDRNQVQPRAVRVSLQVYRLEPMVRFFRDALGFEYRVGGGRIHGIVWSQRFEIELAKGTPESAESTVNKWLALDVLNIDGWQRHVREVGYEVSDLTDYDSRCVISAPELYKVELNEFKY